jgi:hypothetical protein
VTLPGDDVDDTFVAKVHKRASARPDDLDIPRAPRRPPARPLKAIAKAHPDRNDAMRAAWATSYAQSAEHFGVRFTTAGRHSQRTAKDMMRCYDGEPGPKASKKRKELGLDGQ